MQILAKLAVPQAYAPVAFTVGLAIGYLCATGLDGQALKFTVTVPVEQVDLPDVATPADLPDAHTQD